MFEDRDFSRFKIPVIIVVGLMVLGGGIYIGLKTTKEPEKNQAKVEQKTEEEKTTTSEISEGSKVYRRKKDEDYGNKKGDHVGNVYGIYQTKEEALENFQEDGVIANFDDDGDLILHETMSKENPEKANKFYAFYKDDTHIEIKQYDAQGINMSSVSNVELEKSINVLPTDVKNALKSEEGLKIQAEDKDGAEEEMFLLGS